MIKREPGPAVSPGQLPEVLIFLHIPKTAGTTVRYILERECESGAVFGLRETFSAKQGAQHPGIARLLALPPEESAAVRVITGHMAFGLHTVLGRRATYATVLRHPVDRLASHYYFVRARPDHYLHQTVVGNNTGLLDYAGLSPGELDNGQVRLLGACGDVPYGALTRAHLEAAKDNLRKHVSLIGLQDDLGAFLALLQRKLQLRDVQMAPQNVTPGRPPLHSMSPDDYDGLLRQQALDLELYDFARGLVKERAERQGLALPAA
jgi:hypothetical protein